MDSLLWNLELHHIFVPRRHFGGLKEENVFKLPMVSTPKRCETIGHTGTNPQLRAMGTQVHLWNHFSIPTNDVNVLTSSSLR